MPEFLLSPAAERDLEDIWTYTVEHWGADQADRYTDVLAETFAELAKSPKIASTCDYIRPGYRRLRVERHMIYLCVTDYGIAVIRILHDRMDAPRRL